MPKIFTSRSRSGGIIEPPSPKFYSSLTAQARIPTMLAQLQIILNTPVPSN